MSSVDWNKPVQTRDGRAVRVYAHDAGQPYPVHGAIWSKKLDSWLFCSWLETGVTCETLPLPCDVVNIPN